MNGLTSIELLEISNNSPLVSLSGLDNIITIGALEISGNYSLNTLSGLENLTSIESLEVFENVYLDDLNALENVLSIEGDLQIISNNSLSDISGLSNLSSIGGEFRLESTPLTSLNGLENLTHIGGDLYLSLNAALVDLSALSSITFVEGELRIANSDVLTSLNGLHNITYSGKLSINGNTALDDLGSLSSITSIGGSFSISNNSALTSLSGLNNVTSIGGAIDIRHNSSLTSLSGLENIDATSISSIRIRWNNQLSVCAIENVCGYLATANNYALIEDNAEGCSSREEIVTACPLPCPEGEVVLTSQAEVEAFHLMYPYCSELTAGLSIGNDLIDNDIEDLSPLSNIISIGGNLNILNTNLSDLNSLINLHEIEGAVNIKGNFVLTSLNGLDNIEEEMLVDLSIEDNPELSMCSVGGVCGYLHMEVSSASIFGNASGCEDRATVMMICLTSVTDEEFNQIKLFPNPTSGLLNLSNIRVEQVQVFNAQGQRLACYNNPGYNIDLSSFPPGVY